MTVETTPRPAGPTPQVNQLGLTINDYKGSPSTLCSGCGHDAITAQLIRALFESGVQPWNAAKMSGIGCSSKTTTYFMGQSHGFNGVHGRMAAMATGSYVANHTLLHVGVSGDGDTASIGLGNFLHMVRRNLPIVYLIENNGVYGLTKGQLSPTADQGSVHKRGYVNQMPPLDCCALAIEMGCDYVARSFSGDPRQLIPLIKGAIAHGGTAVLDVVSPCMTFNNHEGSTKSLKFAKEHEDPLHKIGFTPCDAAQQVDYEAGSHQDITLADGSKLTLKKLERDYDPTDKAKALALLHKALDERLFLTGLIYASPKPNLHMGQQLNLTDKPLAHLTEEVTRPKPEVLHEIMKEYR